MTEEEPIKTGKKGWPAGKKRGRPPKPFALSNEYGPESGLANMDAFKRRVLHIWESHTPKEIEALVNDEKKRNQIRSSDAAIIMRISQAQKSSGITDMKMLLEYMIGKPAQEINTNHMVTVQVDLAEAARRAAFLLSCGSQAPLLEHAPQAPVIIEQSTAGSREPLPVK